MSKIVLLGEAWGREEAAVRQPFTGATGRELNRLLEETGFIPAGSCRRISPNYARFDYRLRNRIFEEAGLYPTNVLNLHPPGNNMDLVCGPRHGNLPSLRAGKYLKPEFMGELDRLAVELDREKPNLIIGLGATACWFCIGTGSITKRRGAISKSPYGKFLPTFHPAYLFRGAWDQRVVVKFDLLKARREAEFPDVRRPPRDIYIPESLDDIYDLETLIMTADRLSVDIETVADQITCIGFAWSTNAALVIPIFDFSKEDRCYWGPNEEPLVWDMIRRFCECRVPKLLQNALYDVGFLMRTRGIRVANVADDTMLLHHALHPESQKGLGFLGSLYTDEPAWKLMRPKGPGTIKREDE